MVWQFVDAFKKVYSSNKFYDDDFADRLNHRYTVAVLILFCILVGSTQFVGNQISCWAPAHFTGPMVTYTNNICWIKNTYYVPTDETLPNPNQIRQFRINYYQWVPFILAFMAFLFYSPFALWHLLAKPSGLDAKTVMKIILTMDITSNESREKSLDRAVRVIDRAFDYHYDYYGQSILGNIRKQITRCLLPSNKSGCYINVLYLLIKLLYLFNAIGQFFLLNAFMGNRFAIYGYDVIRDLINGKDFWESYRFPRVTMCDFTIRTLGENNQKHTIQCTLPINLFNEKIFIFIWFWLCLVAIFTVYSFFYWLVMLPSSSRVLFIKRYLPKKERDSELIHVFLNKYLKYDGVFLLRIIKKNTNDLVVGELVSVLWKNFKKKPLYQDSNISSEKENEMKLSLNNDLAKEDV